MFIKLDVRNFLYQTLSFKGTYLYIVRSNQFKPNLACFI